MARKFYTCIIVPDTSQQLHKLRVPIKALYLLAAIGLLSFFVTVGLGFHYIGMASRMEDFQKLEADNAKLNLDTRQLQANVLQLNHQVTELENEAEHITKAIQEDPFLRKVVGINPSVGGSTSNVLTADLEHSPEMGLQVLRSRSEDLDREFAWIRLVLSSSHSTPSIWPINGAIGSNFGSRQDPFTGDPEIHRGIDIVGPKGTPVRATADGRVFFARRQAEYGNLIVLEHPKGYSTRYGHLHNYKVVENQIVRRGDVIGYVGMTGRATAPHLHYEVRVNDRPVNPRTFLLQ